MKRITLGALGAYPQTDGKCWMPPGSISAPSGGWVAINDPLTLCTYKGPAAGVVSTPGATTPTLPSVMPSWWDRIPTWLKLVGGVAVAYLGYTYFIKK